MIVELNHVNIATDDVAGSVEFYGRILDIHPGYRPPFDFDGAWLYAAGKPVIHLQAPAVARGTGTVSHAAFEVADFDAAKARLSANDITFREVVSPDGRNRQLFFRDPNDATIELLAPVRRG
jgi:catechol 2,3-dioxygenase-like lactoylglutathione lyase family enzyme